MAAYIHVQDCDFSTLCIYIWCLINPVEAIYLRILYTVLLKIMKWTTVNTTNSYFGLCVWWMVLGIHSSSSILEIIQSYWLFLQRDGHTRKVRRNCKPVFQLFGQWYMLVSLLWSLVNLTPVDLLTKSWEHEKNTT